MRAALAVCLGLLLTACALNGGGGAGSQYRPLSAYISGPDLGGLGFHVNRPAYVALFEVFPGRGTSLVYPGGAYGSATHLVSGGRIAVTRHAAWGRMNYRPASSFAGAGTPVFYFLIASDRPLNLSGFGAHGMEMTQVLRQDFLGTSPYRTLERIAEVALPGLPDDGSWTSDVYVHWPQALSTRYADGYVPISCGGYGAWVSLEAYSYAYSVLCDNNRPATPTPGSNPGSDSTSTGTPGVVEPERRPPGEPEAGPIGRRVRASVQLEGEDGRAARAPVADAPDRSRAARERARARGGDPYRGVESARSGNTTRGSGGGAPRAAPAASPSGPSSRAPATAQPAPGSGGSSSGAGERCRDC